MGDRVVADEHHGGGEGGNKTVEGIQACISEGEGEV